MRGCSATFRRRQRRGTLIVSVLVSLTLAVALFGFWLRIAMIERQHVRLEEFGLQAEYLAESGVNRALAQVAANPNYKGEKWHIEAGDLGGRGAALVTLQIEPSADNPAARVLKATADFPSEGLARVRRSKQITLNQPAATQSP